MKDTVKRYRIWLKSKNKNQSISNNERYRGKISGESIVFPELHPNHPFMLSPGLLRYPTKHESFNWLLLKHQWRLAVLVLRVYTASKTHHHDNSWVPYDMASARLYSPIGTTDVSQDSPPIAWYIHPPTALVAPKAGANPTHPLGPSQPANQKRNHKIWDLGRWMRVPHCDIVLRLSISLTDLVGKSPPPVLSRFPPRPVHPIHSLVNSWHEGHDHGHYLSTPKEWAFQNPLSCTVKVQTSLANRFNNCW